MDTPLPLPDHTPGKIYVRIPESENIKFNTGEKVTLAFLIFLLILGFFSFVEIVIWLVDKL